VGKYKELYAKYANGQKPPSKADLKVLQAKAKAISDKESDIKKENMLMQSGKHRNNNWVIQLEEI
jgi:hypothetical protein